MEERIIDASKLRKVYKLPAEEITALKDINFQIEQGEFVTIMGPSGAGKTTLLNLIGCLDGLSAGKLEVMGHNLSLLKEGSLPKIRRKNIGFVFQEFFLISSLTTMENVELALYFARVPQNQKKVVHLLDKIGLGHRLNHLPHELSGGEMQRAAIARALITSPKILLADEPTGNLDTKNAQSIFDLFRQFNREEGVTTLIATHNIKLGSQADRIIHLVDGKIDKDERVH
jgi:putative ABC transport system ATP-binding protein